MIFARRPRALKMRQWRADSDSGCWQPPPAPGDAWPRHVQPATRLFNHDFRRLVRRQRIGNPCAWRRSPSWQSSAPRNVILDDSPWSPRMVAKFIEIDNAGLPMAEWFHALGELDGSQLAKYLRQALAMRDAAYCALRYIEERDDRTWCPEVYALFERALPGDVSRDDPRGQVLEPVSDEHPDSDDMLALRCAMFLAKHDYRTTEVVSRLAANEKSMADAVLLVLQYVPDRAMDILRRCMQSSKVRVVSHAAAVLALIGGPESEAICAIERETCSLSR